ncbi:MAG TPA: hypothetical protein P5074_12495 [Candidatus Nanopelagicales bacterium]|nr:hypothetical protein [Candidatus Nanopelagicales bacterium]
MTTTTKTAAELLAERKALNNAIRAAQRAEKAAAAKAILDAQHALGLWLAEATELTTVDAVEAARAGLDLDAVRALVHAALAGDDEYPQGAQDDESEGDESVDGEAADDEPVDEVSSPHGHEIGQRLWN